MNEKNHTESNVPLKMRSNGGRYKEANDCFLQL